MPLARWMIVLALLILPACSTPEKVETASPPPPPQLPVDPDDPPEVIGWWSNGREIACIHPSGLYVILPYPDPNASPVEYGRWTRESYAFLWLEPYDSREYERARVPLDARDGTVKITFPGMPPMTATDDIGGIVWPEPSR